MKHSLSLSTFNSSLPFATSRYPSEEAAQRLADQIADVLPGVRLDTQGTWLVFPAGKREKSKYDLCILNSGLQPLGTFRSVRCVIRLLQQLQQKGVLLPGVTVVDSSEGLPCSEHGTAAVLSTEPDQQQAKAIAAALKQIGPVEYRLVQPQGGSNISGGKHAAQAKQQSAKRKVQHQNNVQSTADACRGDQTRRKQQLARHQHGHQLQQQMDQGVGQTPLPKRQRFVDLNKLQGTTRAVLQQRLPQQRRQQQQALTVTTGRHQGVESSSKRSTHGPSSAANFKVSSSSSSKQQQRQLHTSKATAKAAGPSRQKNVVKPMAGQKRGREEQQQQRKQRKQQRQPAPAASARTKQQHTLHQLENSTAALSSLARRQHYQPGVRLALPDGRLPCPAALKQLTDFVALQLPGAVLDSRWLVYPSITKPDKKDIVIRHPDLPQGKFRSSKGLAVFLSTVVGELDRMGISRQAAVIPGLDRLPAGGDAAEDEAQALSGKRNMRQPTGTGSCSSSRIDSQQQQLEQQAQAGPSKVALLPDVLLAGLKAAGGGFQFQGSGSGSGRRGPSRPPGQQNRSGLGLLGQSWCHPPIDASYSLPKKGPVLVLAMFFASAGTAAEGDQGYASHRDRARLLQLQQGLGYKPYSFDLDHAEADAEGGQHVQGNFNSHRGARDVAAQFPGVKFNAIFLDYFRVPSGYAAVLYKPQLFTQFIPELVKAGAAAPGVRIYIPNNEALLKQLAGNGAFSSYSSFRAVPGSRYPLYVATAQAEASGDLGGEYSNSSEVRELIDGSEFVVMKFTGSMSVVVAGVKGEGGGTAAGEGPAGAAGASEDKADGSATAEASAAVDGAC